MWSLSGLFNHTVSPIFVILCVLFPKAILFNFYFTLLYLVLCRVAAVKSLHVQHHIAGYILFTLGSLSLSGLYFENRIPLKPALRVYAASQNTVLLMKRLNQTDLRFSWFCVFFVSKGNPYWLLLVSTLCLFSFQRWSLCYSLPLRRVKAVSKIDENGPSVIC